MAASTESERAARGELAKRIYDKVIRARVEPAQVGKFVVVDVRSEDYEVDADKLAALDRLKARRPDAEPFVLRAGYPTAATLGAARQSGSR